MWQDMNYDYHKILRIPVGTFRARGKDYLTHDQVRALLTGNWIVTEKVDGKTGGLGNPRYVFYYEDLFVRHTVEYDALPAPKIIFDVWDKQQQTLLSYEEMRILLEKAGLISQIVPLIDTFSTVTPPFLTDVAKYLRSKSRFSTSGKIEGVVIKNYGKQLMGKIVDPAFEDQVDAGVHPMKRKVTLYNTVIGNVPSLLHQLTANLPKASG